MPYVGGYLGQSSSSEGDPPVEVPISPLSNTEPGTPGAFPSNFDSARDIAIVEDVVDVASTIAFVSISVGFSDRNYTEQVYAGLPATVGAAGFFQPYKKYSTITGSGAPGVGFRFSLRRDDGWPGQAERNTTITTSVRAVDSAGNVL